MVGSLNFSQTGHRNNIELNLTSQERGDVEAFKQWYDNQWVNTEKSSEEIVVVIENSGRCQEWKEHQKEEDETSEEPGTYSNPLSQPS